MIHYRDVEYVEDNYDIESERISRKIKTHIGKIKILFHLTTFATTKTSLSEFSNKVFDFESRAKIQIFDLINSKLSIQVDEEDVILDITYDDQQVIILVDYEYERKESYNEAFDRLVYQTKQKRLKNIKTEKALNEKKQNQKDFSEYHRLKLKFENNEMSVDKAVGFLED